MIALAHRSPMPDTVMAHAFLRALIRLARRHAAERVTLPSGRVDAVELRQVVIALVCAQSWKEEK
jgi:hypothetical protein